VYAKAATTESFNALPSFEDPLIVKVETSHAHAAAIHRKCYWRDEALPHDTVER
jgi:hypothetical protein